LTDITLNQFPSFGKRYLVALKSHNQCISQYILRLQKPTYKLVSGNHKHPSLRIFRKTEDCHQIILQKPQISKITRNKIKRPKTGRGLVTHVQMSIASILPVWRVNNWVSDWMRERERFESYLSTDFRWRKATNKFPRKGKQLENVLKACNCRQGWRIRKREGWQDKKRIYLLARRWSRIPQHSRSRSCSNVRIKRGHWNLLLNRSPVLCFLIALDSLLSLSFYPPSPQTWLALPSSSMLPFFFLQVRMKKITDSRYLACFVLFVILVPLSTAALQYYR